MDESSTPTLSHQPDGPLILVVDDSPEILALLTRLLTRKAYRVVTAENGGEALTKIEAETPRLILLDMSMPVMDGWEFVKELRNRHGRSIPVVIMTAAEESKLRADAVGADSYIGKPFQLTELYEVVEDTALD